MNYEVLLLGLLVGCVNYCFRYLPPRLGVGNAHPTKRGVMGILLNTIGIASIYALLVVPVAPEVVYDAHRFMPMLVGFVILNAGFYKTRSVITPTLLGALGYGLAWKMLVGLQIKAIILKK